MVRKTKKAKVFLSMLLAFFMVMQVAAPCFAVFAEDEPVPNETEVYQETETPQEDENEETEEEVIESEKPLQNAEAEEIKQVEPAVEETEETQAFSLPAPASNPVLKYHGLQGDFYLVDKSNNFAFTDHKGTYTDKNIAFSDLNAVLLSRCGTSEYAGAVWTGYIVPPEDGSYTFYSYSDNGIRLYIDDMNTPIINWWVNEWDKEQKSQAVTLEGGKAYEFKFEWFQATGGSHATVSWSNDKNLVKSSIASSAFYLPDDFKGPKVEAVDMTQAQIDLNNGQTGGTISLKGENLLNASVKLGNYSGNIIQPEINFNVISNDGTNMVIEVPNTLKAGIYTLIMKNDFAQNKTEESFYVIGADGSSDRPEHPRPDWKRDNWVNLNGWWDFSFDNKDEGLSQNWQNGKTHDYKINVPFPWESEMSGIQNTSYRGAAWYERELVIDPSQAGKQLFVTFGAVDANCKIFVNGTLLKEHKGGYTPIEVDVTSAVNVGSNKLTVWVEDDASYGKDDFPALVGKQGHNAPCGYTHTSGIWQTVYLEAREKTYLDYALANPDVDNSQVQFDVNINSDTAQTVKVKYTFESKVWDEDSQSDLPTGSSISYTQNGVILNAGENLISLAPVAITNQKLWNFDTPNLYYGTIEILDASNNVIDKVETYFGQRKISVDNYNGRDFSYVYINDEPVFMSGLLDQGFWEEGIYTAPSEEALKYDIKAMKDRGFNMIRKHLKLEDPLQYYWTDKLGMFVWMDMPHATYMNVKSAGGIAPGREIYENALDEVLIRDYNHPSIVAVMLFNETWGINHNGGKANDGYTTHEWMEMLYNRVKSFHPDLLVEDMSPCNWDHIQPTDINSFHMYPKGYTDSKKFVANVEKETYKGSSHNFWGSYKQDGEPWFNSEYGGVAAYDKDWDVSWCFKYQTDIQRQYEKLNGFVYTEPFDVEYERNGILTYDRRDKIFGYDEVAYGGDMSINDLTQPCYVGIDIDPAKVMKPGSAYSAEAVALNWSKDTFTNAKLKWRFDATDMYGNNISTGISGEFDVNYAPYTKETKTISFNLPDIKCVGTITVWVEDASGNKLAKNFVNLIARETSSFKSAEIVGNNTLVLSQKADKAEDKSVQNGYTTFNYEFTVPSSYNVSNLENMRLLVEASSIKEKTLNNGIDNSEFSQTTVGSERASDMTVSINGVEIDTVNLPDNPRDIRGTLTLPTGFNGGSSAGNFGYLVNVNVPKDVLTQIENQIAQTGKITVTYSVKTGAANSNGLRIYGDETGRYMLNPTVLINTEDEVSSSASIVTTGDNYSLEAKLDSGDSITARNGGYTLSHSGTSIVLKNGGTVLGEFTANGETLVKITLFDDHITVYQNNNPVPEIDVYDYSSHTGDAGSSGVDVTLIPESYESTETSDAQQDVQIYDSFNNLSVPKPTFASRFTQVNTGTGNIWNGANSDNELKVDADMGDKLVVAESEASDVIVETDITIDGFKAANANGNLGVIIRGENFTAGVDNASGYYIGLGIQGTGADTANGVAANQGFIQVGRMNNNWTELAKVPVDGIKLGETYRLKVVAVGPRIRVYLDDNENAYVDIYDNVYAKGSVALRAFRANGSYDNLVISTAPRYEADFEGLHTSEWSALGSWFTGNGKFTNVSGGTALVGNGGWGDYELSAKVNLSDDNSKAGLALRANISKQLASGYYVILNAEDNKVQFVKSESGIETIIAETAKEINKNTDYTVTVRAVNNAFRVYVDDIYVKTLTAVDNDFSTGKAGVVVKSGGAEFDDVKVKDKFIYEEEFHDGSLAGWSLISGEASVNNNTLTLAKKSLGDKIVDGYATLGNFTLTAKIKLDASSTGKSNAGFVFRSTDFTPGTDNLYGYVIGINYNQDTSNPKEKTGLEIGDIRYGWRAIRSSDGITFDPNQWHDFKLVVQDNKISAYVDGNHIYDVEDDAYSYGQFGIRNYNAGVHLQNLVIVPEGEEIELNEAQRELGELIDLANKYEESKYTPKSWSPFEDALKNAKEVFETFNLDEDDYYDAFDELYDAIDNLILRADKTQLEKYINDYSAAYTDSSKYTTQSWDNFEKAMQKAITVKDDLNATKTQVSTAAADLVFAVNALTEKDKEEANKQVLKTLAKTLEDELALTIDYPKSIKKAAEDILKDAKAMIEDKSATQNDVDELAKKVAVIIQKLIPLADVTELKALVEKAEQLSEEKYTEETWAKLVQALDEAKSIIDEQEECDDNIISAAYDKLVDAIAGLKTKTDKRALENAIDVAQNIINNKDNYTPSSVRGLDKELEKAKVVFENKDATQKEIDDITESLLACIIKAKLKADKTKLVAIAARAVALNSTIYTDESYKDVLEQLEKAQTTIKNEDATDEEVENAERALELAISKLVKKTGTSGNNGNSNSGGGSNNTNNSNGGGKTGIAKTGDDTNILLYIGVLIVSVTAIVVLAKRKRAKS